MCLRITEKYDYEHTQKAIEKINETVGTQIRTQVYDNILDMVQALYDGSVDAMLMNGICGCGRGTGWI